MVSAQSDGDTLACKDAPVLVRDLVTGHAHVVEVGHHVPHVGHLDPGEGVLPGPVAPRPHHHGLGSDFPRSKPGPWSVGGRRVHWDTNYAGIQLVCVLAIIEIVRMMIDTETFILWHPPYGPFIQLYLKTGNGQPHEGGNTGRSWKVILVSWFVEIAVKYNF